MNVDVNWFRVATIFAIGIVAVLGVRMSTRMIRRALVLHADSGDDERRIDTIVSSVGRLLGTVVVLIMLMLTLSEFGISITPLLGAAGVAGIAIGLAAQGLAKDFIRGFSLLFDDEIRVGDSIEIAGKKGVVEAFSMRAVTLRDYDGSLHFVPAGDIRIVTNRSHGFAFAVLDIEIGHGADVDKAMAVIKSVADEIAAEPGFANRMLEPIEIAGVERWSETSLSIRARIKVQTRARDDVRREMLRRLISRFPREGIEIVSPRMTLAFPDHLPGPLAGNIEPRASAD